MPKPTPSGPLNAGNSSVTRAAATSHDRLDPLVLDTSAILGYASGSIAVGETIIEVVDEAAGFALPTVCLAEACRRATDDQMSGIQLLAQHISAVITGIEGGDWRLLAEATRDLGRVDLAAALNEADHYSAYVLTGEPNAYGDDLPVIPI